MGLKRLMPLRKRARQSLTGVVVETMKPGGRAAATIHLPNGKRVAVTGIHVPEVAEVKDDDGETRYVVQHDGRTSVRSDDSARSEVVAWTTSFRMFVKPFGRSSGARDFIAGWAKRGIKVFPLTTGGKPTRDVYKGQDVYLWGAQFPEGAPPDAGCALAASPHVALTWETTQAQSNGMAYRREMDQRRANKPDKLGWKHGSPTNGVASFPGR